MDWLKGMNSVTQYIENNLTHPIQYESLSRIVGCSVYEFSRIFSFMECLFRSIFAAEDYHKLFSTFKQVMIKLLTLL